MTSHQSGISLRKAFENVKKAASLTSTAQEQFHKALMRSKYHEIELPDDIVDVTDYGMADMSYEKFIKRMDELLKKGKTSQEEVNSR